MGRQILRIVILLRKESTFHSDTGLFKYEYRPTTTSSLDLPKSWVDLPESRSKSCWSILIFPTNNLLTT